MRLKYTTKTGGHLFHKGTEVEQATLEQVRTVWPGMQPNPSSEYAAVWLPGIKQPTLVHKSHLTP